MTRSTQIAIALRTLRHNFALILAGFSFAGSHTRFPRGARD